MTNVKSFLIILLNWSTPKRITDTITIMEKIGHFLDDAVVKIYKNLKKKAIIKVNVHH